ncbi:unnamed protein product [[Actinomadura] parvosata subsp. kistnae]|uniref:Uncharacterized protein n=1 Tax=[Actinomadura] parvosata subsp. kistnae TaxID=1909395 RepID=A0A1U9ZS99_9ACTN|nr:hypothetical protein [Nonomuraea sp. ATCC 55076]AQZ60836.1 hypothetical protein BKM31_04425 [Nonomuraea sp. ATCC 55076]SPL90507.1 unnamed protein product [Actinomadura parvosata subsp. kistnae]
MRRHRFGTIATFAVVLYVIAVLATAVATLVTGRLDAVWWAVLREPPLDGLTVTWWVLPLLLPVVAVQGWAYWQILRGPVRGDAPPRDRRVTLLRWTLYLSVAWSFLPYSLVPWTWWQSALSTSLQFVTVVLYFLVLRCPLWLRLAVLAGGSLCGLAAVADALAYELGFSSWLTSVMGWSLLAWVAWMLPILLAQARDPRFSRATVWLGALSVATTLLHPSMIATSWAAAEVPVEELVWALLRGVSVFGAVWQARAAHDLASPIPATPPRPARLPARPWPPAALAVVLPLLPAAANLARGMPFWHGPRGVIELFLREDAGGYAALAWLALDLLIGVGAPALLVLAAVVRRTRRLILGTALSLIGAAAVGVIGVLTTTRDGWGFPGDELPLYPDGLFVRDGEIVLTGGVSPLWFAAAFVACALVLLLGYAPAPARRPRHHVLATVTATAVVLAFLPAADHAPGPVTAAADCEPRTNRETYAYEEPKLTPEQRFVCDLRRHSTFRNAATTPDQVLLAHGRRLCGVYTRNDAQELARMKAREGLTREALTYPLAAICPSAAAVVKEEADAQEREFQEWEADARRMCAATPRHRPLIKPVKATRVEEPQGTDYGVMEAYGEPETDYDPASMELLERAQEDGLVAARPGHLMVLSHSDFDVCVTVETYDRRPPVETKGWDHVVEVGYRDAGDSIVLADAMGGDGLPDLALKGYRGPYRIRVHYAWFPWKGERQGGQRLLVMAFPGKGGKAVTYRKTKRQW